MAIPQVQEHEVESLLGSGKLVVKGEHHWKAASNKGWELVSIPVESKAGKPLSLRIIVSVNIRVRSLRNFSLIWNNNIRVRSLDVNGSHENKHTNSEKWLRKTHKHKWTDECQDRFAYTPTDITAHDVRGQFEQFCAECGIECNVALAEPPGQGRLFDGL
jgi:hypothetical protein